MLRRSLSRSLFKRCFFHNKMQIVPLFGIFTGRNEVVAKVMFLLVSVILSTGGSASVHAGILPPPQEGGTPRKKNLPCQGDPPAKEAPHRKENPPAKETPQKENPLPRRPPTKETPHQGDPPCQGDPLGRRHPPGKKNAPCQGDPLGRRTPLPRRPPGKVNPLPRRPPREEGTPQEGEPPPGPHPRGKLRGIRSRPTPKGDQVQAHTQGGN